MQFVIPNIAISLPHKINILAVTLDGSHFLSQRTLFDSETNGQLTNTRCFGCFCNIINANYIILHLPITIL